MPSIFLVEDHPMMRRILAHFLQKHGNFTMWDVAPSAEEALDRLAQADGNDPASKSLPDLVLLDVSLPGMSGIELLAILQTKYPGLLCLMLSGQARTHYVQQSLNNGARGYVVKGNPPLLLDVIHRVLAGEIYRGEENQA